MSSRFTIVGLGEALFDIFPDKQILGGAPMNVAVHAHQLAASKQGQGVIASRVGQDALGQLVFDELKKRSMDSEYLQADPDRNTGEVFVQLDAQGQPTYDIIEQVAYDWLQYDPDLTRLAKRCDAVCFGSLAQRNAQARNTIYRFLGDCKSSAIRMFDVNLRQDFYNHDMMTKSCELANVIKLNNHELPVIAKLFGWDAVQNDAAALATKFSRKFGIKLVALTRGEEGTILLTEDGQFEGEKIQYPLAEKADAVGAGDACSAAILVGQVLRMPLQKIANVANHAGAFVASQLGATPTLPPEILAMIG